ncbi:MAG: MBL fold metallo-hydrolase [Deltaproteobacteria bacterium]|nr:MBL fold metallo-hydrolase [Deltaproteobacteria bacterium]
MILKVIPVGLFQCNCIILGDPATKEAIVIDPGDAVEKILKIIKKQGLLVRSILHTHTHIDHIGATTELQRETNARVLIHKEDLFLYEKIAEQASYLGLPPTKTMRPVPVDEYLTEGQALQAGKVQGEVIHTPGHTPGSCAFHFPKGGKTPLLLAGDTLFAGSIGRTDLWKGDYDQEIRSIKKKLLILPEETVIIPGHGPKTTVGLEKANNPFLN